MTQFAAPPRIGAEVPAIRLELRHGAAPPSGHQVVGDEFLIGSVPGCDLRLPGTNLPPVIAQIIRRPEGIRLRKLAPAFPILLNGQPVASQANLAHGDTIRIGAADLLVHFALAEAESPPTPIRSEPAVAFHPFPGPAEQPTAMPPAGAVSTLTPQPDTADVWQQYQREVIQFREEKARFDERLRWLEQREREIEQKHRQLEEHERELEADRVLWYQRREQIEQECREQARRLAEEGSKHVEIEQTLTRRLAEVEVQRQDLLQQQQRLQTDAQRLNDLRQRLEEREREVEGQFRELTTRLQSFEPRWRDLESREQALNQREAQLKRIVDEWTRERQASEARLKERSEALEAREAALVERELRCASAEQLQAQYHADLERLDRRGAALDQREQELAERAAEMDRRYEQLQRDAREMEEQARLLDGGQARLHEEAQRLARQKAEQEAQAAQLAERFATLEGQQAMLATLRTRLERMREELRQQAQQVASERAKQEDLAAQIQQRLEEANRIRSELENESKTREQEKILFDQRSAALHAAVLQMKALQEKLEGDHARLQERSQQLDQQAAEQAEQAALLKAKAQQLLELQSRIEADRKSLREREANLLQAEEARKALQEQLLRRSEELTTRGRELDDRAEGIVRKEAELARRREEIETERQRDLAQLDALRQDIDARSAEIQRLNSALSQREEALRRQLDRLKESGRNLAAERKALFEARRRWDQERKEAAEQLNNLREQVERFRAETLREAQELVRQMPELEIHSQAAIERLAQSRDQLRGHLQELHAYSRQAQEDLQELRSQIQAEADRLRQQELALQRARSEHRLAVTAFRQQLIDWQGRVAEMKQFFSQNESRLEQKQAAIEAAAREIDETSKQLSKQAETLQQQRREVAEQKIEVQSHLREMQEWYRRKLRELTAGRSRPAGDGTILELPAANSVNDPAGPSVSPPRDILTLTGDVDPADRKLGELLLHLGLADEAMLIPLWNEARRQRRSLRQVLLSSGTITLYQMALIEASNLDGLALGRFRVVDRLQVTPHETIYRVFDPKRSETALLRHLSEAEMQDAVHPDEYRQRFAAAAFVSHPNLVGTWEVDDIQGRPAVLQEWVTGLPANDWPAFAAAPGVWYRLLGQAALGMQAAHQAGLFHGRFSANAVTLMTDGTVKLSGFGEPAWLHGTIEPENPAAADMAALGRLAVEWSLLTPPVKRGKPRLLPETLLRMIRRMGAPAVVGFNAQGQPEYEPPYPEHERYPSIGAMLDDLDQAGAELPANSEAWERLIKFAGEHATGPLPQRRTA